MQKELDKTSSVNNCESKEHATKKLHQTDCVTVQSSPYIKNETAQNCNCLEKGKREAFFEKLITYLEKQSEVIQTFCLDDHNKVSVGRRLLSKASVDQISPCQDHLVSALSKTKHPTSETGKSDCKIYVEVCTCHKTSKVTAKSSSNRLMNKNSECDELAEEKIPRTTSSRYDSTLCQNKVDNFYRSAEEICQGYLKQCRKEEAHQGQMQFSQIKNEEVYDQYPSRIFEDENHVENGRSNNGLCRNITMEVDCHGTKQEYVIEPCNCPLDRDRVSPQTRSRHNCPKSCLELFEEKYGKMLKEVHAMLCHNRTTDQPMGDMQLHSQPVKHGYLPNQPNQGSTISQPQQKVHGMQIGSQYQQPQPGQQPVPGPYPTPGQQPVPGAYLTPGQQPTQPYHYDQTAYQPNYNQQPQLEKPVTEQKTKKDKKKKK